jgi:hypothetical protein
VEYVTDATVPCAKTNALSDHLNRLRKNSPQGIVLTSSNISVKRESASVFASTSLWVTVYNSSNLFVYQILNWKYHSVHNCVVYLIMCILK